jgi:glycosyltransferase involved in cell wall biosynthesis
MKADLTVVIPTLNEALRLPRLLDMLSAQTRPAGAVVVADARSTDATRVIAENHGAIVVEGGTPAFGRNAGAAAATTELILFLDADVEPDGGFIERAEDEFLERALGCAAGQMEPVERDLAYAFACDAANLYLLLMQHLAPHAPGSCILVRREVHETIGGFDETVVLGEDHEYVQRAAKVATFRVLRTAAIRTSMRRIEKEGLLRLAIKYLYCEMYAVTGRPIHDVPFDYEFAAFDEGMKEPRLLGPPPLRERLEKLAEPVADVSANVRERLRALALADIPTDRFEQLLHDLAPEELAQLRRYISRRIDIARTTPPIALWRIRRKGDRRWRRPEER